MEPRNLYRIRNTTLELLQDRGYNVDDELFNLDVDTFKILITKQHSIDLFLSKRDNPEESIYVQFFFEASNTTYKTTNFNNIVLVANQTKEDTSVNGIVNLLIVLGNDKVPNNATKKEITNSPSFEHVAIFKASELLFNIVRHDIQPKFELMNEDEIITLLERYNIKPTKLPKLKYDDPVRKYYGYLPGNIIRITRFNYNTGNPISYRLVSTNL
jgi:DNA-directed RNA polymerase I, II, and III subunit RPABC1